MQHKRDENVENTVIWALGLNEQYNLWCLIDLSSVTIS